MATTKLELLITAQNQASKELSRVSKDVKGMGGEMNKASGFIKNHATQIRNLGFALTGAATAMGFIGYSLVKTASDAEEIQSKFNVVFKGIENDVNSWADTFARDIGRANQDIKKFTAGIADVLKPMGLETKAAAEMSKSMVGLALDVASFNNVQDEQVIKAFTSALTGERESLKTLGIVITEADVKQEAYSAGITKVGKELTKEAKAQATVNLLFKNSKDAQGDLERTSESYANKTKKLQAQLKDLREEIGDELLPIATDLVKTFSENIEKVKKWTSENPELTVTLIKITGAVGGLMAVLGPLLIILPGLTTAIKLLRYAIIALSSPISVAIGLIVGFTAGAWKLSSATKDVSGKLKIARSVMLSAFGPMGNLRDMFERTKNTISKLPSYLDKASSALNKFKEAGKKVKDAFKGIASSIGDSFSGVGSKIKKSLESAAHRINKMISGYNDLPGTPNIKEIRWQYGGMARKGQMGMVGEQGPEYFVPSQSGNIRNQSQMGTNEITININDPVVREEQDLSRILELFKRELASEQLLASKGISL